MTNNQTINAEQILKTMNEMDNSNKIKLLKALSEKYFGPALLLRK